MDLHPSGRTASTEGGSSARIKSGGAAVIDPKYVPQIPAVKKSFDSFADYCKRVGVQCPTFEA